MDRAQAELIIGQVRAVVTVVSALRIEDLEAAAYEVERFDAFGPFFANTSDYLRQRDDNLAFGDIIRALTAFRRVVAKHEPVL